MSEQHRGYRASPIKRRKRRSNAELETIDAAIIEVAEAQHPLSVRAIYYRLLSLGVPTIDKSEAAVDVVQRQVLKLRRARALPYRWITDGTRIVLRARSYADADEALDALGASYRKMLWLDQPIAVMVFAEKDAIRGTLSPVTHRWDVPLGIRRGYASETFLYGVAAEIAGMDKPVYAYDFGDHDPSGVDQWNHFQRRIRDFLRDDFDHDNPVVFQRLAVTEEQITSLGLQTRPTKATDTRACGFAGESVDVDAISPEVLRTIAEEAITSFLDPHQLAITRVAENAERAWLQDLRIGGGQDG